MGGALAGEPHLGCREGLALAWERQVVPRNEMATPQNCPLIEPAGLGETLDSVSQAVRAPPEAVSQASLAFENPTPIPDGTDDKPANCIQLRRCCHARHGLLRAHGTQGSPPMGPSKADST